MNDPFVDAVPCWLLPKIADPLDRLFAEIITGNFRPLQFDRKIDDLIDLTAKTTERNRQ